MLTMVADVVDGGYVMMVILNQDDVTRVRQYDPMPVPMGPLMLNEIGPCRMMEIAYVKPEDEAELARLFAIGDGEAIAHFVKRGNPTPVTNRLVYRKLSGTVQ